MENSPKQPQPPDSPREKTIAVVAIHGVGDHPPFVTAREIGDLLSNLEYKPSNTPRYAAFTEVTKRINVRPVIAGDQTPGFDWTDKQLQRDTWGPMDAMAKFVFHRQRHAPTVPEKEADNSTGSLDHLFMKGQLIEYKGEKPEDTFQCLRLEGKRVAPVSKGEKPAASPLPDSASQLAAELRGKGVDLPRPPIGTHSPASPGVDEKTVHIYEMYWSDLSQLGNAFTRIFSELYQLLFHLASVSVNNVLAAAIHFNRLGKGGEQWQRFARAQSFAAAVLAWPIPILNLYMAALVPVVLLISLMRSHLSEKQEFITLDAFVAMLCLAGSGYALFKLRSLPGRLFPLPLLLVGALAVFAAFGTWNRDSTEGLFAILMMALTLGLVWLVIGAYDKQRPGSKRAAVWVGAILAATVFLAAGVSSFGVQSSNGYPAIAICLNILEIAFALLALSWAIFYAAYIWAHIAGWLALASVRPKGKPDPDFVRARRTRWTARLILALSSIIFLSLTLSVWTGVIKVIVEALPGQENAAFGSPCAKNAANCASAPANAGPCEGPTCAPVRYKPLTATLYSAVWNLALRQLHSPGADRLERQEERHLEQPPLVSTWANQVLLAAGIMFLPLFLVAFLIALLIALWAMFPSVWSEVKPPDSSGGNLDTSSSSLGEWLDRGFRFMRWGGELLYWTMWIPVVLFVVFNFAFIDWLYKNWRLGHDVIAAVGTVVAGTALGVLGFAGRLSRLSGGFRPLLRVLLDVDNWLREHPRDSNPTARICGRYVSLLRHISEWRDPDGRPYDALVIIAHSQGTVITADFLRFLQAEKENAGSMADYDPELKLFDGDFPIFFFTMGCPLHQLYGLRFPYLYGWARSETPDSELLPGRVPDIGPDDAPRPNRLGVKRWVNAYRSGDYIGRYLWRGGSPGYEWDPAATRYDEEWDPPAGKPARVSADRAGRRIEFCIGPGAHTHYWDHTGELIAEVLDRLINNA